MTSDIVTFHFGKIYCEKSNNHLRNLTALFENETAVQIIHDGELIHEFFDYSYSNVGLNSIEFYVDYNNGTSTSTKSKYFFKGLPPDNHTIHQVITDSSFVGYDENFECNGSCFGKGEYKIFLAEDHSEIVKPYILIDGFDIKDNRKIGGPNEVILENRETIYSRLSYNEESFADDLKSNGYDLVILNFPIYEIDTIDHFINIELDGNPYFINNVISEVIYRDGGADYIERNSKVLQTLIREINAQLIENNSIEEIVVAGPSMGALIVQHALCEMESNLEAHNVRLFFSFDGPHLGANISIGLQKAAEYFEIPNLIYSLNTIAAKQMLIKHYLADSSEYTQGGAPGFREVFQSEINNIGFPTNCRNVAISSGSLVGTQIGIPEAPMFQASAELVGGNVSLGTTIYNTSSFGSNLVFSFNVISPSYTTWFTDLGNQSITRLNSTDSNYGSLDNSPGGFFDIIGRAEESFGALFPMYLDDISMDSIIQIHVENNFLSLFLSLHSNAAIIDLKSNFCFVPTKSSIAFTGNNSLWDENIGCRDLLCTGETLFDNYYAPLNNQEHASLNTGNVSFALSELNQSGQDNSQYGSCNNDIGIVEGSNTICFGNTEEYFIDTPCGETFAAWETSSNLDVLFENNTSIVVQLNNSTDGSAYINYVADDVVFTKHIVGKPSVEYEIAEDYFPEISLNGIYLDLEIQGVYSIEWIQTGGTGSLNISGDNTTAQAMGSPNGPWHIEGYVNIMNTCGTSLIDFYITPTQDNLLDCQPPHLTIEQISLKNYKVIDPCYPEETQIIDSSELYNQYGIKIQDLIFEDNMILLEDNLQQGIILIILAKKGDKFGTKSIIIE